MAEDGKHGKIMMREYMEEFMKYLGKMWAHARKWKCVWKMKYKIKCLRVFTSVFKCIKKHLSRSMNNEDWIRERSTNIGEESTTGQSAKKEETRLDRKVMCFSHNLEQQSTNTC